MDLQIQPDTVEVHCDEIFSLVPTAVLDRIRVVYATPQEVTEFKSRVALSMNDLGFTGPTVEIEGGNPPLIQSWGRRK